MSNDIPGTLTIAAVPIGCLDDASPRLAAALGRAQIIAAEDTWAGSGPNFPSRRAADRQDRVVLGRRRAAPGRRSWPASSPLADVLLVTDAAAAEAPVPPGPAGAAAGVRAAALRYGRGRPATASASRASCPRRCGKRSRRLAEQPRTMIFFGPAQAGGDPRRSGRWWADSAGPWLAADEDRRGNPPGWTNWPPAMRGSAARSRSWWPARHRPPGGPGRGGQVRRAGLDVRSGRAAHHDRDLAGGPPHRPRLRVRPAFPGGFPRASSSARGKPRPGAARPARRPDRRGSPPACAGTRRRSSYAAARRVRPACGTACRPSGAGSPRSRSGRWAARIRPGP